MKRVTLSSLHRIAADWKNKKSSNIFSLDLFKNKSIKVTAATSEETFNKALMSSIVDCEYIESSGIAEAETCIKNHFAIRKIIKDKNDEVGITDLMIEKEILENKLNIITSVLSKTSCIQAENTIYSFQEVQSLFTETSKLQIINTAFITDSLKHKLETVGEELRAAIKKISDEIAFLNQTTIIEFSDDMEHLI